MRNCFWTLVIGLLAFITASCNNNNPDPEAPQIKAIVTPAANSNGWHKSDVTVSFECFDGISGIISCPDPVLVSSEGADQVVTGTARDVAGNTADVSVTVNLDKTSPALSNLVPADNEVLPDPEVNLVGDIAEELSGIETLDCDAGASVVPAAIEQSPVTDEFMFGCSLPLEPGDNVVRAAAADVAGNVTTVLLNLNHTPAPVIVVESPDGSLPILSSPVTVSGSIDDTSAVVTVNGVAATIVGNSFEAPVPIQNGKNTITAIAQNIAGQGTSSVDVLGVLGLNPTVRIVSPVDEFVLGQDQSLGDYPLTIEGWVRDNRLVASGVPAISVRVNGSYDGGVIDEALVVDISQESFGLCRNADRCWRYTAVTSIQSPNQVTLSFEVEANTGGNITTRSRSGLVDFCYRNNGGISDPDNVACSASLYQRPDCRQSRRCIWRADGCSAPLGPLKDDPTLGIFGLSSTAFGAEEFEGTAEGQLTVFGQPRQNQLPCNLHDECYHQWCPSDQSTGGVVAEKQACNDRFYENMKSVCQDAYPERLCPVSRIGIAACPLWRAEKNRCYVNAFVYYRAVVFDANRYDSVDTFRGTWPYSFTIDENTTSDPILTMCEGCPPVE